MWQHYFSQTLQEAFESAKATNRRLSLRSYAKQLEMSPGLLSEILRGQRRITAERALEIADRAQLDDKILSQLRKMLTSPDFQDRDALPSQALNLILNSLYYQVLCALEVLNIPASPAQLCDFLRVDEDKLEEILTNLEKLSIVRRDDQGVYWEGRYLSTTEDIPNEKIRQFHENTLKDSVGGLNLPPSEREYTTVIFAGCDERLPEAKQEIRRFRDHASDVMRDSKPNRIYQLSIQLRPLSPPLNSGDIT